jgi:hypothetical protein
LPGALNMGCQVEEFFTGPVDFSKVGRHTNAVMSEFAKRRPQCAT